MGVPEILFEDKEILVVYKPAGMAVQTKKLGQQDMESWLKNYRAGKKENPYIGLVHRLDQPVEGIMLFAKTPQAAAKLSSQVQSREIGKHYYAIGSPKEGTLQQEASSGIAMEGTLTDYLTFDPRRNLGRVTSSGDPQAKKAVLDYKVIGRYGQDICFDISLHTGRHHQIRLQLMQLGYPLAGDGKYGGRAAGQIALCSYQLTFTHPATGKKMHFSVKPKNPAFAVFLKEKA